MPHEEDDLVQAMGFNPVVGATKGELLEQFLKFLAGGRKARPVKKYAKLRKGPAIRESIAAGEARLLDRQQTLSPSLREDIASGREFAKRKAVPMVERVPTHETAGTGLGMSPEEASEFSDLQRGIAASEDLNLAETLAGGPAQSTELILHTAPRSRVSTSLEGPFKIPSSREAAQARKDEINYLLDLTRGQQSLTAGITPERALRESGRSEAWIANYKAAAENRLREMGIKDPLEISDLADALGSGAHAIGSGIGSGVGAAYRGTKDVLGTGLHKIAEGATAPFRKGPIVKIKRGLMGQPEFTPDELIRKEWQDKLRRQRKGGL